MTSILNLNLDYELEDKKYYITLAGKRLKTKKGNEIFVHSVVLAHAIQEDYAKNKFKSKWINLVSSYVDFIKEEKDILGAKNQLVSYLKNDLLLYLDNTDQKNIYMPLINQFEELLTLKQKLVPTTSFDKVDIIDESIELVNAYIAKLSLKKLFVSLFLTRISTSSILTILYLEKIKTEADFFAIAFASELVKLDKTPDNEEQHRLNIIKSELDILDLFFKDGLTDK